MTAAAHIPHAGEAFAVLAVVIVLAILYGSYQRRQRYRQQLVHAIVADVRGFLKTEVVVARPTFGRPAERWQGRQLLYLHLRFGVGHKDTLKVTQEQLPLTIAHRMGPVELRWDHVHRSLIVTPKPQPKPLPIKIEHPVVNPNRDRLPFATTHADRVMEWNLVNQPHALVVGATGSGKSVAIRALAVEAVRAGMAVTICDPKRVSFLELRNYPGVTVATTNEAMVAAITAAHDEQERRYAALEAGTLVHPEDLPKYLLVIDELHEFIDRLDDDVFQKVKSIARMGREGGVHLLVGIQRPDNAVVGGSFRDQLALRIALGHLTGQCQQMVGTSAQVTSDVKGRALAVVGESATECQVWLTPARAIQASIPANKPANDAANHPTNDTANVPANKGLPEKLTDEKITRIRQLRSEGLKVRQIAAEVGVSNAAVQKYSQQPFLHLVKPDDVLAAGTGRGDIHRD